MRAHSRFVLAALLLTAVLTSGCDDAGDDGGGAGGGGPTGPLSLKLVSYNIGNADDAEPHYPLRLSYQPYEDHVGAKLRALEPDVVLLQEVLPPETCELFEEADPGRTCFDAANRQPAAQRILAPEYTVVCDGRQHVECIGVKRSFGTIEGIEPGAFVLEGAETPPLPLPPCVYAAGECDNTRCDAEATVSAVTITTANGPLRLVHAHPNAAGSGASGPYLGRRLQEPPAGADLHRAARRRRWSAGHRRAHDRGRGLEPRPGPDRHSRRARLVGGHHRRRAPLPGSPAPGIRRAARPSPPTTTRWAWPSIGW